MNWRIKFWVWALIALIVLLAFFVPYGSTVKANESSGYENDMILLKKIAFSVSGGEPIIPEHLKLNAPPPGIPVTYLVKMKDVIREDWKNQIERHAKILSYIPYNTYIVKATESQINEIAKLQFVQWHGIYHPYYKISPSVYQGTLMKILVFDNVDAIASAIAKAGGLVREVAPSIYGNGGTIIAEISSKLAENIAFLPDVRWIEKRSEMKISNSISAGVIQSGTSGNTPIWNHGLYGEGQIIGESDTGIDWDHEAFRDPANFQVQYSNPPGSLPPNLTHRKIVNYHVFVDDHDLSNSGHGTHVACTIAGNNSYVGGTNANGKGMAPSAKLSFADIGGANDALFLPPDLNQLYQWAYNDGARLHSNSWGDSNNDYGSEAMQTDEFMWNHKDMLIFFAAGNSGPSTNTVGNPGTAKNIVTVGATSYDGTSLADFSSRGPTQDGRRKPTVCAPGSSITSADSDGSLTTNNSGYISMSGTSMATPTTAGGAALVREYYTDGWYPTGSKISANAFIPSAALIKATLINSAIAIGTYSIPDNNIGWGRIQLDNALYFAGDTERLRIVDFRDGLQTGEAMEYSYYVSNPNLPLKITLVWTDYPGDPAAAKDIVNDLNLEVTAPDNTHYLGNVFSGGVSVPGGTADSTNVEECVYLNTPQPGIYRVKVIAANVPMGPQDFALVLTGGFSDSQGEISLDRTIYPLSATLHLKVIDPDASGTVTVVVNSTTEHAGETVLLTETAPSSHVFTGTLQISQSNSNGVLQVSDSDTITAKYTDASAPIQVVYAYAKVDGTPPQITGVHVNEITANSAVITWTTNEPATAKVIYGTSSLDNIVYNNNTTTTHSIQLYALQPNTTYQFFVESADHAGNIASDNNGGMNYSFTTGFLTILLIDEGNSLPLDRYYRNALSDSEWSYGVWSKGRQGTPSLSLLQQSKAVVWHTSNTYPQLDAEARALIGSYLDAGGKLVISGQDIGWDLCDSDGTQYNNATWYQNYLHATYSTDNDGSHGVSGVPGDPIGDGINATLNDVVGGYYPDGVSAGTGAYPFLNYASGYTAGVRYLGSHGVVYYAFAFEDITQKETRAILMDRSLKYLLGSKPTVIITSPQENTSAYGIVDIFWNATDTKPIVKYDVYLSTNEGAKWDYITTTTVNTTTLDFTPFPDGAYMVKVVAIDEAGIDGSATVRVIKTPDDVGVEKILEPQNGFTYPKGEHNISAEIKNYGPNTQNSFDVRCAISRVIAGTETIFFTDDFETDKGWTHMNTGGNNSIDEWQRGTPSGTGAPAPHSGSNVWATNLSGNYAATPYAAALVSPVLNLSDYDYVTMKYWQWVDIEGSSLAYYDGGLIEITTDGNTWVQIDEPNVNPQPYYNGTISSGYSNPLAGKNAFSGRVKTWVEVTVNLTNWAGNPSVKVRFNFGSDSSESYLGWYIDDVMLIGKKNMLLIEVFNQTKPTGISLPQNDSVNLTWAYNFSEPGMYKITVKTELAGDNASGNDAKTIYINITGIITINHMPVTSATVGAPIEIYANITDIVAPLTDVKVFYQPVGENISYAINMSLIAGTNTNGTWYVQIPAQNAPGTLYYYIQAWDSANNTALSPENGTYQVTINPGTPEILHFSMPMIFALLIIFGFTRRKKRRN
ncbi:MAG: S8 family serine peptidase [Thermoplasmata archaeon]